jgi:ADP-ribose pyrophosphatase YjhB (NUDIX family)
MEVRISVRAIILHSGNLLCVRQKHTNDLIKSVNNYWNIPGGKLNKNESLPGCLSRELVEETGVKPEVGNLMYIQQFTFKNKDYLEFFFNVTNSKDYLKLDLSKTTHGHAEIEEVAFHDPSKIKILPKFLGFENLIDQMQLPVKLYSYL